MNGIVFDIQHYAIYDGPGIRTLIFLKGCPLKCVWCQNPESQKLKPQMSYFKEKCLLCESCVKSCPNDALKLINDEIIRDEDLCVDCGTCVEACPNNVMEKIGMERSSEELVELVLRDKPFYDTSGGGVTISGGEPTMQINFLLELLKSLKKEEIHTAIETCGYFKEDLIERLVEHVDLFLFDIKHINSDIHKEFTGVTNDRILNNFKKLLLKVGIDRIIPRIPLIPGVNIDLNTLNEIALYLLSINYSGPVHLMPYNKLAKTKYEKIGIGALYREMGDLTDQNLIKITKLFEKYSFKVIINH